MNITGIKTQLRMQEWTKLIESQQGKAGSTSSSGVSKITCTNRNITYYLKKTAHSSMRNTPFTNQNGSSI